ncbi:MAG TPA: diguanylate cyclase, partial [Lachnospiraceae bacterium]|nr:diguanylate cyclase [Lachnospiraceae bacterium]
MKKLYIIILVLLLSFGNIIPIQAKDRKVIKVGYPIQQGLTEKDEEGNYIGYTVDYLNEIKKYTGWSYEFVEVDGDLNEQLITLLKMLEDGEIDVMGGMVYSDDMAQIYDYPGYNYGVAYTTLAVRKDDGRWIADDFQHWDGIKVGIYGKVTKRMQELEKFANVNGFTYEVVEKDNYEEMLASLESGEIDAMLQVDISMEEDLRAIAKFSPVPYYFAISKGNQDLVREMNSALSNIASGNPYLQANLYEKYFNVNDEFVLSEENRKYIESLGTIKVLLMDGNAPIQYYDKKAKGIAVSYLEKIKEKTGLQYEIIVTHEEKECMSLIKNRKIDLILGVPSNSDIITELDLNMSLPY